MNGNSPTDADIARKAYALWEAEGRPEGRDIAHWHQAIRDVTEPVILPIPDSPAPEIAAAEASVPPKPRAPRARKPKAAVAASEAAPAGAEPAKPKATRRRKAAPDA